MAFEGEVLRQVIAVANKNGIEPAALLAVVEVESAGKSLEQDGRTPCLLFERHVFFRELKKAGKTSALNTAVSLGLAHSGWKPKTQYKDQGTSAKRLELFRKARSIDEECAVRSCSWGVGQTMGFLAEELKFANARQMFTYLIEGGVPAQVECMVREIKRKKILDALNKHDWATFALKYNGTGYKQNAYDTKMATAYNRLRKTKLPDVDQPKPVVVPKDVVPPSLTTPVADTTIPVAVGASAGGASVVGFWGYFKSLDWEMLLFGLGIFLMITITWAVLKRRKALKDVTPAGVLPEIEAHHQIAADKADAEAAQASKKGGL